MTPHDLDGLTPVPAGKVPAIVTHLAMNRPARPPAEPNLPEGVSLDRLGAGSSARYLALFRRVGAPWLWVSRLKLPPEDIGKMLADSRREAHAVMLDGQEIGIIELDTIQPDETELVYFGLIPSATGKGLGTALMHHAVHRAFARPILRITVHTCTLDDPSALPFYRRMGFRPVRQEIELIDDPRLDGTLPEDCAPQIPLIRPGEA
jgi:GNAT superfamily N-acetyltransferase